jgi:hypothetical protein
MSCPETSTKLYVHEFGFWKSIAHILASIRSYSLNDFYDKRGALEVLRGFVHRVDATALHLERGLYSPPFPVHNSTGDEKLIPPPARTARYV